MRGRDQPWWKDDVGGRTACRHGMVQLCPQLDMAPDLLLVGSHGGFEVASMQAALGELQKEGETVGEVRTAVG